ncbi:MAG: hypothetical protein KGZ92_01910 [Firmicutes bacterium]|nr:hypothetical protein [Dethiobacter sp.]MBS3888039.1 hypothetical protein [Bacillota bacterium]
MRALEWNSRAYRSERRDRLWYCIAENIVLNAAIFLLFFHFNPLRAAFITMNIHPLLILVSLMSLRYGNYLGILSAVFASATFVYAYHLLGRDLVLFVLEWSHYKFILMFFLAAVILGSSKDRADFMIDRLQDELFETKNALTDLSEAERKSQFVAAELKKQIIGAEDSILSLYEVATALDSLHSERVYTEIMTLLARFLKVKSVGIYLVDTDSRYLRLKVHMGDNERMQVSLRVDEHAYLRDVVQELKVVKVTGDSAATDPLLSAPILKDGKAIAVINVEEADITMVTEYSYNLFKIIVEWISKALTRALEIEHIVEKDAYLPNTIIRNWENFTFRVEEEKLRFSKFGLPFGLVRVPVGSHSLEQLSVKLQGLIRQVDAVGFDVLNNELHILFPITSCEVLEKIVARIAGALHPITDLTVESCHV